MHNTLIFGIDLGTTNSCISYIDEDGKAVVIPNQEGDYTTPSAVQFDGFQHIIGREAKKSAILHPQEVVTHVKQKMGVPGEHYTYNAANYSPEEISALILHKLATDAALALNQPVQEVVITCPAYFGIAQREATVRAGTLAGLTVHQVIDEPAAASILYCLQERTDQVVLVYDLGGGTFDVSIVSMMGSNITTIAIGGDNNLGGFQWDILLAQYLDEQWMAHTNVYDTPMSTDDGSIELFQKAEDAKKSLSVRERVTVPMYHKDERFGVTVTREHFQKLTANLLEKTIAITKDTLAQAFQKGIEKIDQIILVGGSTRMPQVKERLASTFAVPIRIFDPDLAVAKGAALYAQKLLRDKQAVLNTVAATVSQSSPKLEHMANIQVTNVASHSFGLRATDIRQNIHVIANLVLMNEPLPAKKTKTFKTAHASQENVEIIIIENRVNQVRVNDLTLGTEIAKAILLLPPHLPQYTPIEVTFLLQQDGRLHISAVETHSGLSVHADVRII